MSPTLLVIVVLVVLLLGFALYRVLYEGRQVVGPTEWIVVKNGRTGELDAYPPGVTLFGPEWVEFMRIRTNLEQIHVNKDEEVPSKGTSRLGIQYRYSIALGRKCRQVVTHPGWYVYDGDPHQLTSVTKEQVVHAASLIKQGDVEKRIAQAIETALEETVGQLRDEDVTSTDVAKPLVPTSNGVPNVAQVTVDSRGKLRQKLAEWVQAILNRELLPLGIGVVNFSVTNLRYLTEKMQEAQEEPRRKRLLGQATKAYLETIPRRHGMSVAEAAAAGTDAFGQVVEGKARERAINSIGEGMKALAALKNLFTITNNITK